MQVAEKSGQVSREGWLKKKPSSQHSRPWKESTLQKRFFVTRGFHVSYYNTAKPKDGAKPNGSFDLRRVTVIRPLLDRDATAKPFVLDMEVQGHKFAVDFGYAGEMREWLRLWMPAIADHAIPDDWELGQEMKAAVSKELREALSSLNTQERNTEVDEDEDEPEGADADAAEAAAADAERLAELEEQLLHRPATGLVASGKSLVKKISSAGSPAPKQTWS